MFTRALWELISSYAFANDVKIVFDVLGPQMAKPARNGGQRRNTTRNDFTPSLQVRNRLLTIVEYLRTAMFRSVLLLSQSQTDSCPWMGVLRFFAAAWLKISVLQGYYAASPAIRFPTFREKRRCLSYRVSKGLGPAIRAKMDPSYRLVSFCFM